MARRKIVFVIVEGPSDEEALGVILGKIYDKNTVFVHIMHCDITTKNGVTPANILSKIGKEVQHYAASNHYVKKDFQEIIHLVDIDGAYIPDESVIYDPSAKHPIYTLDVIKTINRDFIIERNRQKRANLNKLWPNKIIWGSIPYAVFYMSCNLDHVLYCKLNSTDTDKEIDSYLFAKKYKDDPSGFLTFISNQCFAVNGEYDDTWKFIAKELHSLGRYTNFSLCFAKHCLRADDTDVNK